MSTRHASNPRGVALVAVLWIVAALSIMVTGLSQAVRSEIRTVTAVRQTVAATALAQAALQLTLQRLKTPAPATNRIIRTQVAFEGQTIAVDIMPLNGLLDINNAPAPLVTQLLITAGGLALPQATALTQAIVDARTAKDTRGRPIGFEAVEDLMRVTGLDYSLYAKIFGLVSADLGGGRINPMAAPLPVLLVLAEGDAVKAANFARQRDAGQTNPDTTVFNGQYLDASNSSRLRIEVRVPLAGNDGQLIHTSIVSLSDDTVQGLPWKIHYSNQRAEARPTSAPPP